MFFRNQKRQRIPATPDEVNEIDEEIAKYQNLINDAPQKRQEQRDRERNTIPPPDDFEDRRRQRRFFADLSKGQVINERRYRTRNTVPLVLLAAATLSISWWIYNSLISYGIIS